MPRKIPTRKSPGANHARRAERRAYDNDEGRKADKRFYASTAWRDLRALVIAEQPLCAECMRQGRLTPTEHVHHIVDRKQDDERALDRDNLEGLCESCHSKLAKWGRKPRGG